MKAKIIPSTCTECTVRCGSLIHVVDDEVVKITGNPAHPGSSGAFCIKGMNGPIATRNHPDRPLHPMRRVGERGEGKWEQISWQEALDQIAEQLGTIKHSYGGLSIAGVAENHLFPSRGVAMKLLLRVLGARNHVITQDPYQGCRQSSA